MAQLFSSLEALADAIGKSTSAVSRWHRQSGGAFLTPGGRYSLRRLEKWLEEKDGPEDQDVQGDFFEEFPEEWQERKIRADALRKELELERLQGRVVFVEDLEEIMEEMAAIWRDAQRLLQRQFGNEAASVVEDALKKIEELMARNDND